MGTMDNSKQFAPLFYVRHPMCVITSKLVYSRFLKSCFPLNCISFSNDGRRLYIGNNNSEIHEWLINKGLPHSKEKLDYRIVKTDTKSIRCLRNMRDGNYFFIGDMEGIVTIYRPNIEKILALKAHNSNKEKLRSYAVTSLAFSPNNLMFCSSSEDKSIKIWDLGRIPEEIQTKKVKKHKPIRKFVGHVSSVEYVDWHPQKSLLASGSEDSIIKFWDPRYKGTICSIHKHTSKVNVLEFNRNGNWLLSAGQDQTCRVFDIRMNSEIQMFKGHLQNINCATWHPFQENLFLSAAEDGRILNWILGITDPYIDIKQEYNSRIHCISWHPLGHVLATGSSDACVKLWTRKHNYDATFFQSYKISH